MTRSSYCGQVSDQAGWRDGATGGAVLSGPQTPPLCLGAVGCGGLCCGWMLRVPAREGLRETGCPLCVHRDMGAAECCAGVKSCCSVPPPPASVFICKDPQLCRAQLHPWVLSLSLEGPRRELTLV